MLTPLYCLYFLLGKVGNLPLYKSIASPSFSYAECTQVYETPAEIAMEEDNVRRSTTPAYRAPEMWDLMTRQRIDTKVDIWVRNWVSWKGLAVCEGATTPKWTAGSLDLP